MLAPGCVPTNTSLFLKVKGWDRNLRACRGIKCREQIRKSEFQKMEEGMLGWNSWGLLGKELGVGRRQGKVTHIPK